MDPKVNESVKAYADQFLAILTRIAVALEAPAEDLWPPLHKPPISPPSPAAQEPLSVSDTAGAAAIPYDTVRAAILAYQDAKGAYAALEVLKRFGAKYIMDLKADPSRYAAVLAALK